MVKNNRNTDENVTYSYEINFNKYNNPLYFNELRIQSNITYFPPFGYDNYIYRSFGLIFLSPFIGLFMIYYAYQEVYIIKIVEHGFSALPFIVVGISQTLQFITILIILFIFNPIYCFHKHLVIYSLFSYLVTILLFIYISGSYFYYLSEFYRNQSESKIITNKIILNIKDNLDSYNPKGGIIIVIIKAIILSIATVLLSQLCWRKHCISSYYNTNSSHICEVWDNDNSQIESYHYHSYYYILLTIYWICLNISVLTSALYGCFLLENSCKKVDKFIYQQDKILPKGFFGDINNFPDEIFIWKKVWRDIHYDITYSPLIRSFLNITVLLMFSIPVFSICYFCYQETFNISHNQTHVLVFSLLMQSIIMSHSILSALGCLNRSTQYYIRKLSLTKEKVQIKILQSISTNITDITARLQSNLRILSNLESHLRDYDLSPLLIGNISVISTMDIIIFLGLLLVNILFFLLLTAKCKNI